MEKNFSRTERLNFAEPDIKIALVRIATFFLVFFASHWLLLWLHPFGVHRFLWNLALGASLSLLVTTRLRSRQEFGGEGD